eukprot:CAMPEP_0117662746 /NCGR_PEP_ID=MMETSP0804-20121206/8214_1 /TAXON_ID=1074897 /ORGANISM="Tetraselmis astigmatica, Strain CCMP880" /LENGTH=424 /DNA_ID=CAMNT_0005469659 /DNA_START=132 /DNA_END=1406 /DNA_ORIENTATION=+
MATARAVRSGACVVSLRGLLESHVRQSMRRLVASHQRSYSSLPAQRANIHLLRARGSLRRQRCTQAKAAGGDAKASVPIVELDVGAGGNGGAGDCNGGGGEGGDDDEDDEQRHPSPSEVAEVIATAGNLPKDLEMALKLGTLTIADLGKWQKIRALPIIGLLAGAFQGFRERMMGNPRFLLALAAEEVIGGTAKMAAEVEARGEKFSQELPFVASDMALEFICNFTMVWLLSPVRSFVPPPTDKMSRVLSSLPGHFLQVGCFSWAQRLGNLGFRFVQFGIAGTVASAVGHGLVVLSLKSDPKAQEELAPIHEVAFGWGAFMAISSNMRYQLVNCFEQRFLDVFVLHKGANAALTFGLDLAIATLAVKTGFGLRGRWGYNSSGCKCVQYPPVTAALASVTIYVPSAYQTQLPFFDIAVEGMVSNI